MKLEDYILQHTDSPDEVLAELYRETHVKALFANMISGHLQGKLLEMLSKMIQPQCILEIGTFTGYSAICLARGLKEGGVLHTIERNDELEEMIHKYIKKADLENQIQLHIGKALEVIPILDIKIDLVFIDAHKPEYLDYYHLIFDKVNSGGYIIADNVLWYEKVLQAVKSNDADTVGITRFNDFVHNDPRVENLLLPIRDGLMVIRKK